MKLKRYLDCFGNKKIWEILRLYYETQNPYSGSDVARILQANKMTTIKLMNQLADYGVLDKERVGNTYSYRLRKNHLTEKVILPLLRDEANLMNDIKKDIYEAVKEHISEGYIFGSYVQGKETLYSDLDICLIVKEDKAIVGQVMEEKNDHYIDYYNIKISPYIITKKEFEEKRDTSLIRSILKEGESIKDG